MQMPANVEISMFIDTKAKIADLSDFFCIAL